MRTPAFLLGLCVVLAALALVGFWSRGGDPSGVQLDPQEAARSENRQRGAELGAVDRGPEAVARSAGALALRADRALQARVVDPAGRAVAGATVELTRHGAFGAEAAQERAVSDAEGRVAFEVGGGTHEGRTGFRWRLAVVEAPGLEAQVEGAEDTLLAAVNELRIPFVSTLEVEVEEAGGEEPRLPAHVRVGTAAPDHFAQLPIWSERTCQQGRASWGLVARDAELWCVAQHASWWIEVAARVPEANGDGEVRRAVLRFGSDRVLLRGRLLDAAGRPVAEAEALATLMHRSMAGLREVRTDAEGVFALELPRWGTPSEASFLEVVYRPGQQVRAPLLAEYTEGVHDLGDLRLSAPALLLGGTVLDLDGEPLAGASVWMRVEGRESEGPPDGSRVATTGEEGRFAWVGSLTGPRRFTVWATAPSDPSLQSRTVSAAEGSGDLVLRLESAGRLEVPIVYPEPAQVGQLRAVLEPRGPLDGRMRLTTDDRPGRLVFAPTRAGLYDLVVRLALPLSWELRIEGLSFDAEGSCGDPRARSLDLREHLRLLELSLEGVPLEGIGEVVFRVAGGAEGEEVRDALFQPRPRWMLPRADHDLEILAPNCRVVLLERPRGAVEVTLRAGLLVRLEHPSLAAGEDERSFATPTVLWRGKPFGDPFYRPAPNATSRTLRLPEPGRYPVVWTYGQIAGGEGLQRTLPGTNPSEIVVLDLATEQRFPLLPPR